MARRARDDENHSSGQPDVHDMSASDSVARQIRNMPDPWMMFCQSPPERFEGIRGRGLELLVRRSRFRHDPGREEEYNIAILEFV